MYIGWAGSANVTMAIESSMWSNVHNYVCMANNTGLMDTLYMYTCIIIIMISITVLCGFFECYKFHNFCEFTVVCEY